MDERTVTGLEIAVIGMTCRFPGARDIHEFWDNLKTGREAISFFSEKELEQASVNPVLLHNPHYVKANGILSEIEYFDASFFDYTPKDAELMNPQTRIFHECVWTALEDAGYEPGAYKGLIGLYAGATTLTNWQAMVLLSGKTSDVGQFSTNQLTQKDYLTLRISYKLNLTGPSFILNTACSTSLVAIHLAGQAILNGECHMALAGGITVSRLTPMGHMHQQGMVHSSDGHCRAFDARADGTVGADGAGVVLLKRLEDAIAAKDHIYAVIKGSAINNDGMRKAGFSAASVEGQAEVIKMALQMAEVKPETISYVETHGTGTKLGDPVEIEGLKLAFNTSKKRYCTIGSVKSNLGHTNCAAGVAGFIKTVLTLKHRLIPPSLHFENPNPAIDFENSPFYVNNTLIQWKSNGYPFRAGVSSFGIGGTNAHVVLEEWTGNNRSIKESPSPQLLLLSAKSQTALERMSENLAAYLRGNPGINFADAAYTLMVGRKTFKYRRMLVSTNVDEACAALFSENSRKVRTSMVGEATRPVIFMFAGLGSQYVNMGKELYQKERFFREEMERCFEILKSLTDLDLKGILYPSPVPSVSSAAKKTPAEIHGELHRIEIAQLTVFIFEYALAKLLMRWGIKPHAVIGYSFGEYTAACLSGVFSLEDALKLIVHRGQLLRTLPPGAMLSVPLPLDQVKPLLPDELSIAIDNGSSCVVAGPIEAIQAFEIQMKRAGNLCMRVPASHALHSGMMQSILKQLEAKVKFIDLKIPKIPYISNVTGNWLTPGEAMAPDYWSRHLANTVRFAEGILRLVKEPDSIFVEIGPGQDLTSLVLRFIESNPGHEVINLSSNPQRNLSEISVLLNKMGLLWLWGIHIDWEQFYREKDRCRQPLPTYPFERQRYWLDVDISKRTRKAALKTPGQNTLLGGIYLPAWKRVSAYSQRRKPPRVKPAWLVFQDASTLGTILVKRLRQYAGVDTVKMGQDFEEVENNETGCTYTINPLENHHYEMLFHRLSSRGISLQRIVHCWNISGNNDALLNGRFFDNAGYPGFFSLLSLAQNLGKPPLHDVKLIVLSDQGCDVMGGETVCPVKSAIPALLAEISRENPGISCSQIDILQPEPGGTREEKFFDVLMEELSGDTRENLVAYRNNHRWTGMMETLALEQPGAGDSILKETGVYLLTGRAGTIGLGILHFLVRRVNARLVLTTPQDLLSEAEQEQIQKLEKMGAALLHIPTKTTHQEQMRRVITQAEETFGEINGVLHVAEITAPETRKSSQHFSPNDTEFQWQEKIAEIITLQELFKDKPLDFCWVISLLPGKPGILASDNTLQASILAYFLGGLVKEYNRSNPPPPASWLKLDWYHGTSYRDLQPDALEPVLERLFSLENLEQLIVIQGGEDSLEPGEAGKEEQQVKSKSPSPAYSRPNLTSAYVPPRSPIENAIANIWKSLFGFDKVGIQDDFMDLGGDSLKAINAISKMQKELNFDISLSEFFSRSTIEALADNIHSRSAAKNSNMDIMPVEKREYYVLSSAQRRLYILQQMNKHSIAYNELQTLVLEGSVSLDRVQEIVREISERHEILRTSIEMIDEEPVQRVYSPQASRLDIEYYNLEEKTGVEAINSSERMLTEIYKKFVRPFDLSKPPLLRVALVKNNDLYYILVIDKHHIIADGTSHRIFAREFTALYQGEGLPFLHLQYKDYSRWQHSRKSRDLFQRQEKYWLKEFQGKIPLLSLPTDYPRPGMQSFEGNMISFEISTRETKALHDIARSQGATLFMILLAIYNTFLSKLSGQEDIVVGTPTNGRAHADLAPVMGMFVNTLPLRNYLPGQESFTEILGWIKTRTLKAFENQDYQFEDLVEHLSLERDLSRSPLFDVMLVMPAAGDTPRSPALEQEKESQKLKIKQYDNKRKTSRFDLTLIAWESREKLYFTFEYCTKLFREESLLRFCRYFKGIIFSILENPHRKIQSIEMLPEEEKKRVLVDFNETGAAQSKEKSLYELFAEQAAQIPDRAAILGRNVSITYRELYDKSQRLSFLLKAKGAGPDTIVAVMMKRSPEAVTTILGILAAGAAYLPIEPEYPEERIDFMLTDSNAKILLTGQEISVLYSPGAFRIRPEGASFHPHLSPAPPTSLAYIIYTSGSTGQPKGVMVEQRNIVNYICWAIKSYVQEEPVNFPLFTSLSFDLTITSIFTPLISGNAIVVYEGDSKEPLIEKIIFDSQVGVVKLTPSHLKLLAELGSETLQSNVKRFVLGGEALETGLAEKIVEKFNNDIVIYNEYGPTETTVGCMIYRFTPGTDTRHSVPIGTPAANARVYVLDRNKNPIPVGVTGEIYISGEGVVRGYLNRPQLTAERFINNPFLPGERMYKTGDLARFISSNDIEFLGRIDHQVKIRGFRIELGEIENCLQRIDGITVSVVIARNDESGDNYLAAYIVSDRDIESSTLKKNLSVSLPDYMIPSCFVRLEAIPLTVNGKINRGALPVPELEDMKNFAAPVDEVEEKLLEIWVKVLGIQKDKISTTANFFEIGGHSLKAAVMSAKIQKEFDINISLAEIFRMPTIKGIADLVKVVDWVESGNVSADNDQIIAANDQKIQEIMI